jgi:rhamnogalacturonan hydrolase
MSNMLSSIFLTFVALSALVAGQSADIAGKVGPKTSLSTKKAKKTCSIASYGAVADGKTDISSALNSAFSACKSGGVVVVPSGSYALSSWVTLSGGNAWALQLDGSEYTDAFGIPGI